MSLDSDKKEVINNVAGLTDEEFKELNEGVESFDKFMYTLKGELGKAIEELQKIENKCNKDIYKKLEHVVLILRSAILGIVAKWQGIE